MEEAIRNLYAAVIYKAIKDYPRKKYHAEVRDFFMSKDVPYFDVLGISGEEILQRLDDGKINIAELKYEVTEE